MAFLACRLGQFIIRLRWPQGLLEFIDEKDKMLEEMKGGTPPAEAWRNRVESREASHGYESGRSSLVVFFHWTIPSKGTERRTDAACLALCVHVCASKLQAAKWSAACRGQRDIYLWHDKKLQTHIKHSFICERVLKVCSGILDIVYVYCAVIVFKIQSIWLPFPFGGLTCLSVCHSLCLP